MSGRTAERSQAEAARRCLSVLGAVQRESAELVLPVDGGTALLSPSLPQLFDANLLRLIARAHAGASELVRTTARLAAEHALTSVTVTTDDPVRARALAPGFAALEWVEEQHVMMLAAEGADRPPHRWAPVAEVEPAHVVAARREWLESNDWAAPALVEQFLRHDRRLGDLLGERCFAVHLERRVVSYCRLLQREDVAQIEDVVTSPLHRNKGYARAVVAAARAAAGVAGARDVFLVTDAHDWPRLLYQRLGFAPARVVWRFRDRSV
ncbi:MAG: GNAT family N-acetyltransferase [Candidatus Dormibacteria bacterium]